MLKVDRVHVIRHKYHQEGLSISQVARELRCSRNTVSKYLDDPEPKYRLTKGRPSPIRDEAERLIEEILQEWSGRTTPKQRITGSRIHLELLSRGLQVGVSTVRKILKERRRREAEVFVPLIHRPGDEAQVDFFEVTVEAGGQRRKVWMFLMRLMYSKRDFAWLYERCDQLAFLDGHVRAFKHFGGVPHRCIYDNLSPAVKSVMLPRRELTKNFSRLVRHYLFEPCFARIGRGDDKGGVEARGKGIRLQHMTPIPKGDTLGDICEQLLGRLDCKAKACEYDGTLIWERFLTEHPQMLPSPAVHFDARRIHLVSVDKTSMVQVEGVRYSLPSSWSRLSITAHVGVQDIEFACRGLKLVRPRGQKGQRIILYSDYLRELARKPQAVRQVAPELMAELGEPFGKLWSLLQDVHGPREGSRIMAKVLQAVVDKGETTVSDAIWKALQSRRIDLLSIGYQSPRNQRVIAVPAALAQYEVESSRASDFNFLMMGASA